jgi:SagB-type dehydrogenase family enzyme
MISLPKPDFKGEAFEETLKKRRSAREYTEEPITLLELSLLLFAAQGITGREQGYELRAAPSAGALYPMETYVAAIRVDGLKPGIYHYAVASHALELVKSGDFRGKLTDASLGQEMVGQAAATFIITSIFERSTYKYGERGYRYAYIEAGHISQNLFLQATSLGLGSVCVGAFFDDKINKLIDVDGKKEAAIYIHCVGRK